MCSMWVAMNAKLLIYGTRFLIILKQNFQKNVTILWDLDNSGVGRGGILFAQCLSSRVIALPSSLFLRLFAGAAVIIFPNFQLSREHFASDNSTRAKNQIKLFCLRDWPSTRNAVG